MSDAETVNPANGNYSIEVKDFGPLLEAKVDLRPLTVFIGPSNTGKSYLAMLVYALHKFLGDGRQPYSGYYDNYPAAPIYAATLLTHPDREEIAESVKQWFAQVLETHSSPPIPDDFKPLICRDLEFGNSLASLVQKELLRCFGVSDHVQLTRRQTVDAAARVAISIPQGIDSEQIRYQFDFQKDQVLVSGQATIDKSLQIGESYQSNLQDIVQRNAKGTGQIDWIASKELVRTLVNLVLLSLLQPITRSAFYLPSGRTGIMNSHHVVVSTLIQNATTAGLRASPAIPLLSGVLADFLSGLISTSSKLPLFTAAESAERIERKMLDGAITIKAEAGYPSFAYRPYGSKTALPLMRTSSMVSELAPVVLYLRHLVRPSNLLIIEEPESHLHPAMQAAFARELARLVRSGVRVLLTTHSEWLLEQIGNLVQLSKLPEDKRAGIEGADCALSPEQVGAWLFQHKKRPKGSIVSEIKINHNSGVYPTDFSAVSDALYNTGAQIFNSLQDIENQ